MTGTRVFYCFVGVKFTELVDGPSCSPTEDVHLHPGMDSIDESTWSFWKGTCCPRHARMGHEAIAKMEHDAARLSEAERHRSGHVTGGV